MRVDLLMFDLDGTLVDSRADIAAQVDAALVAAGFPSRSSDEIVRWVGRGARYLFENLTRAEPPVVEALVHDFSRRYAEHLADATRPYPGALEALEHYARLPKLVITNKGQRFADALLDALGLRGHFKAVFGAEAFERRKPDPLPLREACRRFGVEPGRAAFVGDSWPDMAASKACGTVSVCASYGYGDLASMRELAPDYEIGGLADLIGLFG